MAQLPKWMVDTLETILPSKFFKAEVVSTEYFTSELVRISFKTNLTDMDYYPGWAVFMIAGTHSLRHYTISSFNRETGVFSIIFHLHGNGLGSDLAASLKEGMILKMAVPGGKKMYVYEQDHHFFFGDETSLGFIHILKDEIVRSGGEYNGIIELRDQNQKIPESLTLSLPKVLSTPDAPASQALQKLNELKENNKIQFDNSIFYLIGNVASVQTFRKELKALGVNSKKIKIQGYWAEGSVGL